jgi:hypothetical protein
VLLVLENKGGYYLQSINLKDGSVAWSLDI